jgi:hypothetical protein
MKWLAVLVGIGVVVCAVLAATTYLDLQRKLYAEQEFKATLERLFNDEVLCVAVKKLRAGEKEDAVRRLDLLLCQHVLVTDDELASADARSRECIEDAFRRIALLRQKAGEGSADNAQLRQGEQSAAEKVLLRALGTIQTAQSK